MLNFVQGWPAVNADVLFSASSAPAPAPAVELSVPACCDPCEATSKATSTISRRGQAAESNQRPPCRRPSALNRKKAGSFTCRERDSQYTHAHEARALPPFLRSLKKQT